MWSVELVADDDLEPSGWRSFGASATYRLRWMARWRARRENEADRRLGQTHLGTWTVFGPHT